VATPVATIAGTVIGGATIGRITTTATTMMTIAARIARVGPTLAGRTRSRAGRFV
jgi:hypothetical protein